MRYLFFTLPLLLSAIDSSLCTDEMLFRFFPEPFVIEALQAEGVSKEKAEAIAKDLVQRDRDIVQRIEERASKMAVNPIQDPSQQEERAELFRAVIRDVYADALGKQGIASDEKMESTLQSIQQMRLERFENCRREGKLPALPTP